MKGSAIFGMIGAVVVVIVAIVLFSGDDETASVRMLEPTALGLREGSDVRVGGVSVGHVKDLGLNRDDRVKIDLTLDDEAVHLGRNASVVIKSVNLLGEKYVALDPGTAGAQSLDHVTIPPSRVTSSTDLDQVLDVLDSGTRARLAVLVNEAGIAMTGRHEDFNALLLKLPSSLDTATRLLGDVVSDNHTLADLITHTDSFLDTTVKQRGELRRFVDSAAGAAGAFASRQNGLRATLDRAPAGLSALRGFLGDLRTTAEPLGPAARDLTATAPQLTRTLAALKPFRAAAKPTLDKAIDVAPALSRLGTQATPVVRASVPTLASLDTFVGTSKGATRLLGISTPDLLGILEGWGRAIQGRDNRGHVFHGRVTFGAGFAQTLFQPPATPQPRKSDDTPLPTVARRVKTPALTAPKLPLLPNLAPSLSELPKKIQGTVTGATQDAKSLLDYLLRP